MSCYRVAPLVGALACGLLLAPLGCSSSDERPPATGGGVIGPGGSGGSGGSGGGSGSAGESGQAGSSGAAGQGGSAGLGGSAGSAGLGGAGTAGSGGTSDGVCGNNIAEQDEDCDGVDLAGESCVSLGFDDGILSCVDCGFDESQCTGVERCFDGVDNDADGDADCGDTDCAAYCADPCAAPLEAADPISINGDTFGKPSVVSSSCLPSGATSGSELVFLMTPVNTGVVDIVLTSSAADFTLSARSQCDVPASELGCTNEVLGAGSERLVVEVQQGQPIYIVLDGADAGESGNFVFQAYSRPLECGDAHRDPGEACDDGNISPGDGCSATCTLESSESEPNDTVATADDYVNPFLGSIDSSSDVDVVKVVATEATSNIVVDTFDFGDGACSFGQMDTVLRIYDASSNLLIEDDDGGDGYCAHAALGPINPGDYYVEVSRAGVGPTSFPYFLVPKVDFCGNGFKSETEECDDGNTTAGDGCGPTCIIQ